MDDVKASVRRDLEYLLNTSKPIASSVSEWGCLRGTILDFGLAETSGFHVGDSESETKLAIAIEQTIRAFEPRLANVTVAPIVESKAETEKKFGSGPGIPHLSLRVKADLLYMTARQRVQFQAVLDGGTRRVKLDETIGDT